MWLFVVAAGSGYLARCLQNASSSTKKPRLLEPVTENEDQVVVREEHEQQQQRDSRSPPQEAATDNYPISDDVLKFKEQLEKLETLDETDSKKRPAWYTREPDALEDSLVLSYQKGTFDAGKTKGKARGWPSWPKLLKDSPASRRKASTGASPTKATMPLEPEVSEFLKHQLSTEREVHVNVDDSYASPGKESCVMQTPVSLRQETVSLESLFDWASMASSQEPLVFGEYSKHTGSTAASTSRRRHSRGRNRSADSSVSSTPATRGQSFSGPVLSPIEMLGKRKAAETSPACQVSPRELLLFAAGLHTGISSMLVYQVEKAKERKLVDSRFGGSEACFSKSGQLDEIDDNESVTSVATVEHTEPDQMAVLEAELEAELELMEFNMRARNVSCEKAESGTSGYGSPNGLPATDNMEEDASIPNATNWAISPRDLDRRLHLLLEERQEERIKELEAELQEAERKLTKKDEELLSWKLRVNRLKALSLASSADDAGEERPISRRKWFSEPTGEGLDATSGHTQNDKQTYEVFIPETPNRSEAKGVYDPSANGAVPYLRASPNADDKSAEELKEHMESLTLKNADSTKHSFRDFLENARRADLFAALDDESGSPDGCFPPTMGRRFSTSATETVSKVEVTRNFLQDGCQGSIATSELKDRLVCVNTNPLWKRTSQAESYYCQQSQVIRTVQTNCRIEERRVGDESVGRRHSTGASLRSMNGTSRRQRRRWFS